LIDDYSRDYDDVNVINSKINIRKLGMVQKAPKKHDDTGDGL
jgi:predicted GNAT superfamily acetyltransferase